MLAALKIQELASSGMPFKKVVREVEQFIYQMQTLFVLESLDNLRKNGRLTKLQAVVTSALKIKLLCGATPEGEICKLGQALSMKQALNKLVERIAADPAHKGRTVAICHCGCLDRAFQVKRRIEETARRGRSLFWRREASPPCTPMRAALWWPTDAEGEAERIMQQMVYTPEELERIQMGVLALLCYAKRHDRRELPRCFLFCRTIVKNIDLCREGGHTPEDRAELSQWIREDWKCAMEARAGLPEYYLPDARLEVQRGWPRPSAVR